MREWGVWPVWLVDGDITEDSATWLRGWLSIHQEGIPRLRIFYSVIFLCRKASMSVYKVYVIIVCVKVSVIFVRFQPNLECVDKL
jgi:hypothetical protein